MNTATTKAFVFTTWGLVGLTAVVMIVSAAFMPSSNEDAIGYMLRVTARLAFIFLMLAYMAQPLGQLVRSGIVHDTSRWLLKRRRHLGLSMALAHTVHFGYVVALFVVLDMPLEWITIIFGGLAFVLMWLMAATSNSFSMVRLGKNWKRLHAFGLHYLWLIFMQSFIPRTFMDNMPLIYQVLVLVGLFGLGIRITSFLKLRSHRSNAESAF